eukprot:TRINITY_DN7044_c0_g1_i1.p2 TRINITY_DN7044_c0_g1~~TRINITY_DN7044_c0_g1_i1.p2  ORF type:complete len:129 (-),score=45.60 TRINITY_DN7044_c0_g1_i1:65-451(-)
MGGPSDVRGFQIGGIGPRTDNEALGGEVYMKGGLHIRSQPFFFQEERNASMFYRFHAFLNFGNLANFQGTRAQTFTSLLQRNMRSSVGFGVLVNVTPSVFLEINLTHALRTFDRDRTNAFQVALNARF